jgi:hypothetical protein
MDRMDKIVSNEELRLRITEYAEEVRRKGNSIGVNLVGGTPRYQLMPEARVEPDRARRCVRVGADRFRRDFGDIRVLAFYDDIAFGIEIRGQLAAVFERCRNVRPRIGDEFRAQWGAASDLNIRVTNLEQAMATAKLADLHHAVAELTAKLARLETAPHAKGSKTGPRIR